VLGSFPLPWAPVGAVSPGAPFMFPFPPSPQTPSPGSRPGEGTSARDRAKIILLGASLLFIGGAVVAANVVLRKSAAPPSSAIPAPVPAPAGPEGGGTEIEVAPAPLFPEEEGAEIGKILRGKLEGLPVADGVPAPDAGPYALLLREATVNARVLNLQPDGYDREPHYERMLEGPAAYRGSPVSAAGELLRLERVPFEGGPDALFHELRVGTLRDGKGRLFTFTWPVGSPLEADPVAPGGGAWVRVHGLFYKPWPVEEGGRKEPSLHLVLPRRPLKAYPPVALRDIDPAWMEQVHDGALVERTVVDEDPLFYLLNLARTLGPEGWEGWLKAKQEAAPGARIWPPEDFTGRYSELLARPEVHRFRPVKYTAFLAKPSEIPPEWVRPNPGDIDRFWIGYLVDRDFVPAVWIFSPRSLADMGLRSDDYITVEGLFLKRMAYVPAGWKPGQGEGEEAPKMMQAAVIVAARITKNELPRQSLASDLLVAIVVLMVLMAGALGWAILQGRRDEAGAEERRRARLAAKRAARPPDAP